MRWLLNGNIPESNALYVLIKKKISDTKNALSLTNILEVIEIEGSSFLANYDTIPSYVGIKNVCDDVAATCKKEWHDAVPNKIASIKKKVEDEEAARIKKKKEEEAERKKKQKEAERKAFLQEQQKKEMQKREKRQKISNYFTLFMLILGAGVVYYIYSNFNGWMFGILTVVCIFVTLLIIGMVVPDEDKKEKKVK